MGRFALGLLVGLALGVAATAHAAIIAGDSGYLLGWSILKDGEDNCSDPFVWTATREIECD
jgi:hypothetical protein